jgi:hypothetical protein
MNMEFCDVLSFLELLTIVTLAFDVEQWLQKENIGYRGLRRQRLVLSNSQVRRNLDRKHKNTLWRTSPITLQNCYVRSFHATIFEAHYLADVYLFRTGRALSRLDPSASRATSFRF